MRVRRSGVEPSESREQFSESERCGLEQGFALAEQVCAGGLPADNLCVGPMEQVKGLNLVCRELDSPKFGCTRHNWSKLRSVLVGTRIERPVFEVAHYLGLRLPDNLFPLFGQN